MCINYSFKVINYRLIEKWKQKREQRKYRSENDVTEENKRQMNK